MEGLPISSPQPTTFEGLEKSLLPDTTLLPKIDLKTKNVAQKNFEIIKKDYEELQQKPLDQAQIKLAKNWEKSAKADVDKLKPRQVRFGAKQKTLVDESTSLLAKITQNKGQWENPSFLRKIFYNIEENKQKVLDKLSTKTTDLSERIKKFNTQVDKFNTKASETATKIGTTWTNCTRQIDLYGQARDKQLETSRFLKLTKSKLNDYPSEVQKSLSPKLRQLEALEQRLEQLKTARADNQLDLSKDTVFKHKKDEIERLSTMLQTLTSEIQTTLETSPKKTLSEKISDAFTSVFSRSTVAAKKEALLLALKTLPQEKADGPAPASGVEQGRTAIFGRRSSSPPKDASDIIKETVEKSPQAVVAALEVLVARCEVEPSNTASKKELTNLLEAIQTGQKIPDIFQDNPSLRERIAAAKLYELTDADKAFLKGETTLSEKLTHIEKNVRLWQSEPELILELSKLAQTQSQETHKTLAELEVPTLSEATTSKLSHVADEIRETEKSFLESLKNYRSVAQNLLQNPKTPKKVQDVCKKVIEQLGEPPNSFLDKAPLLDGTEHLKGFALLKKLLENRSSANMKSQIDALGPLFHTKFINEDTKIIQDYLDETYTNPIYDSKDERQDFPIVGTKQYLHTNSIKSKDIQSLAIVGAQRLPRYNLLFNEITNSTNKELKNETLFKSDEQLKNRETIETLQQCTQSCLEINGFDTALINYRLKSGEK